MKWDVVNTDYGHMIRAKVPGGWFVASWCNGDDWAMFFYPDPLHEWDGRSLE
jgi:hypothetical protein